MLNISQLSFFLLFAKGQPEHNHQPDAKVSYKLQWNSSFSYHRNFCWIFCCCCCCSQERDMRTQTHMRYPSIPSHNCCYPELSGRWVDHCCKTSFDSMAVNDSTRIPHLINLKEKFRERKTHTCHQLQDDLWVSTPSCSLFCIILQTWWDNLLLDNCHFFIYSTRH